MSMRGLVMPLRRSEIWAPGGWGTPGVEGNEAPGAAEGRAAPAPAAGGAAIDVPLIASKSPLGVKSPPGIDERIDSPGAKSVRKLALSLKPETASSGNRNPKESRPPSVVDPTLIAAERQAGAMSASPSPS